MGRGMIAGKQKKLKVTSNRKNSVNFQNTSNYTEINTTQFLSNVRTRVQNELAISLTYQHNVDMLSFLLALRDEFSFGKQRLIRVLNQASKHAEYAFTHNMTTEDLIQILGEETGLTSEDITFEATLVDELDLCGGTDNA